MSRTTIILLVAVVAFVLFKDQIVGVGATVAGAGRWTVKPSDYYNAPPPAPNYSISPPTTIARPGPWDVAQTLILQGGAAYREYLGTRG